MRRCISERIARTNAVQRRNEDLKRRKSALPAINPATPTRFRKQKSRITAAQACMRKGCEGYAAFASSGFDVFVKRMPRSRRNSRSPSPAP
jgi:hypothetical protein